MTQDANVEKKIEEANRVLAGKVVEVEAPFVVSQVGDLEAGRDAGWWVEHIVYTVALGGVVFVLFCVGLLAVWAAVHLEGWLF